MYNIKFKKNNNNNITSTLKQKSTCYCGRFDMELKYIQCFGDRVVAHLQLFI